MEGSDAEENPIGTTNTSRISMPFGSGLVFCLSVKLDRKYLVNSKRQDLTPNVIIKFPKDSYVIKVGDQINYFVILSKGLFVRTGDIKSH